MQTIVHDNPFAGTFTTRHAGSPRALWTGRVISGMAVALLTTLYGAVLANLFCLPMSEKLAFYHREEMKALELIVKGVMALQSGENPRLIEQKLVVIHPLSQRQFQRAA